MATETIEQLLNRYANKFVEKAIGSDTSDVFYRYLDWAVFCRTLAEKAKRENWVRSPQPESPQTLPKVLDRKGVELLKGQRILIHQNDAIRVGVVVKPYPQSRTWNLDGYWVDVNIEGQGPEGIPSYLLEVIK